MWGLQEDELIEKVQKKDFLFVESIPERKYKEISVLGEGAFYVVGKALAQAGYQKQALIVFEQGKKKEKTPYKELCIQELSTFSEEKPIPTDLELFIETISNNEQYPKEDVLLFIKARSFLDEKRYQDAWNLYKQLLMTDHVLGFNRIVLSDSGRAALYGGTVLDISFFENLVIPESLELEEKQEAEFLKTFYSARMRQKHGQKNYQQLYKAAIELAQNGLDFDTALWYLLDYYKHDSKTFIALLKEFSSDWFNPGWFSDVLDLFTVRLVQTKNWKDIKEFYEAIESSADESTLVKLAFINALANSSLKQPEQNKETVYESLVEQEYSLYYKIGSSYQLGRFKNEIFKEKKIKDSSDEEPTFLYSSQFLKMLVDWNLTKDLYALLQERTVIPQDITICVADYLSTKDMHDLALRVAVLGYNKTNEPITDDLLRRVYPRPYLELVQKYAAEYEIPENILYALIRSESYFEQSVVSWAGAQGLSQLMQATAEDIARKLKVQDFDILDPEINIHFGAFYLAELIRRLDGNILEALFSYNAGITRVRSWKKSYPLDSFLFLEALPYAETRDYGRKILVASSFYGYLYYEKTIKESVEELF